jgi:hypothetical protein
MSNIGSISHPDLVVCACENQEYQARDAIDAAHFRGQLDSLWQEFQQRVAAEKKADEQDMELDEASIDSAAEAFRYDHDLITAEETEQWLAIHGLNLDDFSDYFARQYCGDALPEVEYEPTTFGLSSLESRDVFAADLVLSGHLDGMVTQLSWRLAAAAAAAEKEKISPDAIEVERQRFFERSGLTREQLSQWLEQLGRGREWFERMLELEAAFRQRNETLVTPQARKREIATLRLQLTRFETELIELESRDAAKEALFCVREDGMSMEEVATEGRYPYRCVSFLHEDIPDDLQQKFLSVSPGDVLEPIPRGDSFELHRIAKKIEPQADDPAVLERVEKRILGRHYSELSARYVEPRLRAVSAE